MTEAAKEARRAYKREWDRAHPEARRRHQEKFWEKKAKEMQQKACDDVEKQE